MARAGWAQLATAIVVALLVSACATTSRAATPTALPAIPSPPPSPLTRTTVIYASPTPLAPTATVVPTVAPTALPTPIFTPTSPPPNLERVQPNELGEIPILEYHLITDQEGRWSRSWENFRRDLERLDQLGYRTVRLQDVIDDRIDVPAGYSPVVLTFDDSSPGQFTFVEEHGKLVPDPRSAVGVLEAFNQEHPEFGEHATFFVLPAADPPHNLFGQDQFQKQKLEYLVDHGMDIGNHTYWHQNLSKIRDAEVERQIGQAAQVINAMVPHYEVDLFALPEGAWPVHRELAIRGEWHGVPYHNRAILLVGAQPALSPDRDGFDPLALPRIQATPEQLDLWLDRLARETSERYVSDGNPNQLTFPSSLASKLKRKPNDRQLISLESGYEVIRLR